MAKQFILWDPKDGDFPPRDEDGTINTVGILGKLSDDNCYLTAYAHYPEGADRTTLEVGQRICGVAFGLSGGYGRYDLYRVE